MIENFMTFDDLNRVMSEIQMNIDLTKNIPVLIGVSEDNPSVIRFVALVETPNKEQFIVISDNSEDAVELSKGTTIVKAYRLRDAKC